MKLVLLLLFITSCMPHFKKGDLHFSNKDAGAISLQQCPEFPELKEKVLTPNCISCHFHEDMKVEENLLLYVEAGRPEDSGLYKAIRSGYMPIKKPHLPANMVSSVKCYIEGVKKNAAFGPETEKFAALKDQVIVPHCIKCHNQFDREKLVLKYIKPGLPEKSKLFKSVTIGDMPMKAARLTQEELQVIRDYIMSIKP